MTAAPLTVSAFYKFVKLPQPIDYRQPLLDFCRVRGIRGTILLAPEGINGTIAGPQQAMEDAMAFIRSHEPFADLESKQSLAQEMPFGRMKVRLKKEIVTMGVPGVDPASAVGTYVEPRDWNALISDPDVLVIDTRNDFEVAAGSFIGAVDPRTRSFGEFPRFAEERLSGHKDRPIAMFCTGGIRCEKATSYLVSRGFTRVHHLKGGILKYLETVPREESLWRGSCFVFDGREGLGHGLGIEPPEDGAGAADRGGKMNGR